MTTINELYNEADQLKDDGQLDAAIEHGVRASELEPEDSFSWTALSVTYQRAFAGTDEHKYIQMAEDAMAKSKMMTGH